MDKNSAEVRFPMNGIDRKMGYKDQTLDSCLDAVNVRPDDTMENRSRGGSRSGLIKYYAENVNGGPFQLFTVVEGVSGVSQIPVRTLVAASNGLVYMSSEGSMVPISGLLGDENGNAFEDENGNNLGSSLATIVGDKIVLAAMRGVDTLVIADYSETKASGEDGLITGGNTLTAASVPDWVSADVDQNDDVVEITPVDGSDVEYGIYPIVSVSGSSVIIDAALTDGACSFTISRSPKVLSITDRQLTRLLATSGAAPLSCPGVTVYRDRAVWWKGRNWFMSRQGNHLDYNYGADLEDLGRAIAGTNADAGQPGQPIVAAVPMSDDYLVFFGEDSIWVMRGDPASGGRLDSVSREIGIVGPLAWCNEPSGGIVFLSRTGMCYLPPGGSATPQELSRQKIPKQLFDISSETNDVCLGYDTAEQGVHIFITPKNGTAGNHWFYDWETKSFWRNVYPVAMQPGMCAAYSESISDERVMTIACRDGYVRNFSPTATTDDGSAINSYVVVGPVRVAGDDWSDGVITEIAPVIDKNSANVNMHVSVGTDNEDAYDNLSTPKYTKTLGPGRGTSSFPRVRGGSCCIKFSSSGRWAMEKVNLKISRAGKERV